MSQNNGTISNGKTATTHTATNRIPEATTGQTERKPLGVPTVADLRSMLGEKRRQLGEYHEFVRETETEIELIKEVTAETEGENAILASDVQFAHYSFEVATDSLKKFTDQVTAL